MKKRILNFLLTFFLIASFVDSAEFSTTNGVQGSPLSGNFVFILLVLGLVLVTGFIIYKILTHKKMK